MVDVAATAEVAALRAKTRLRVGSSGAAGNWSLAVIEGLDVLAGSAKNPRIYQLCCDCHWLVFPRQEDVDLEPANRLLLLPISDCGAGLEVLGERATKCAKKSLQRQWSRQWGLSSTRDEQRQASAEHSMWPTHKDCATNLNTPGFLRLSEWHLIPFWSGSCHIARFCQCAPTGCDNCQCKFRAHSLCNGQKIDVVTPWPR